MATLAWFKVSTPCQGSDGGPFQTLLEAPRTGLVQPVSGLYGTGGLGHYPAEGFQTSDSMAGQMQVMEHFQILPNFDFLKKALVDKSKLEEKIQ